MKIYITLFLVLCALPQKRIINNQNFDYEFYISLEKKIKPEIGKTYFWYRAGEIHQVTGDIGGAILVNDYIKYYKSKQLAEKGVFDNGLKDGLWKSWYENGNLATTEKWKNGSRHGSFISYTESGEKKEEGMYRNHKKHGTWIDYVSRDTLIYKRGVLVPKKQKDTIKREPFLKRLFKKKRKDTIQRAPFLKRIFKRKRKDTINGNQEKLKRDAKKT
ncbi:toxin-antitoxin system YwqK family antitoxin [Kordia zhangzhouensis]|uniref:toxin-antitoxin system YwqK family antitoxin n=1 Tax=Kordia zhangzhouensis TaxID=1620405 RepID=UPI00069A1FE8|nr:hypothetical protein [Kordia zhangzhouensis]